LERRAQWRTAFDKVLENTTEVRKVSRIIPSEGGPAPWPFFFKGRPTVDEKINSAQKENRQLIERLEGLSTLLTEVGHEAHAQCKRAEEIEKRLNSAQEKNRQLIERLQRSENDYQQVVQSRSWRLTRPLRAVSRFITHGHFDSRGQIGLYGAAQRIGKQLPISNRMRRRVGALLTKFRRRN
jgi:predicted nuclease with TOPRIM domain